MNPGPKGKVQEPKIVLFDIETSYNISATWGVYEQNVIEVLRHWYMLSFAWKSLGDTETSVVALPDFKSFYKKNREDDLRVCEALWEVLDSADIVVSHNGQAFDIKKSMARFAYHNMQPPSSFKQFDTLLTARRYFDFGSNKLDDLAAFLGIGRKLPHHGKKLWIDCSDPHKYHHDAWTTMKEYNAHDCWLLEQVYLRLRPYAANHPRLDWYTREIGDSCPTCKSTKIKENGLNANAAGFRQRMRCRDCGKSWAVGKLIKIA